MNARTLLPIVGIALLSPVVPRAEEPAPRPEWDQKKAVATVKKIIAVEESGQPWDKIAWLTEADQAVARAQKEHKPIFIYFYLKKNAGPAAAPC